jgi:hypothetical protein
MNTSSLRVRDRVAAGAPAVPNPDTVNLYQNVPRLKLDVAQVAALHGPRAATLAGLRSAAGASLTAQR